MIPFSIDVFLLFLLLSISIVMKGPRIEKIVLAAILVPALYVFVESLYRVVKTGDEGILIRKLFRRRELGWRDVTHVGILIVRKKVYLLLTTIKGFYILSNAYEKYSALVGDIVNHLDKEKMEEEVIKHVEHPVMNNQDVVMTYFTAIVLIAIIAIKLCAS